MTAYEYYLLINEDLKQKKKYSRLIKLNINNIKAKSDNIKFKKN